MLVTWIYIVKQGLVTTLLGFKFQQTIYGSIYIIGIDKTNFCIDKVKKCNSFLR